MQAKFDDIGPREARALMAAGKFSGQTSALCPGYAQANLVILPRDWAFDFLLFCLKNRRACPLLEVGNPGDPFTRVVADRADVRKELPKYRLWRNGEMVEELGDISHLWRDDLVSFYLGCSFGFEKALADAGLPVRHVEMGRNVPMYDTSLRTEGSDRMFGTLVVSMRPMPAHKLELAREVTGRLGGAHGAPVHAGDPAGIGIRDISRPEYGEAVEIREGEEPVFWACGVTPQAALRASRVDFAITHAPGHMFITDYKSEVMDNMGLFAHM